MEKLLYVGVKKQAASTSSAPEAHRDRDRSCRRPEAPHANLHPSRVGRFILTQLFKLGTVTQTRFETGDRTTLPLLLGFQPNTFPAVINKTSILPLFLSPCGEDLDRIKTGPAQLDVLAKTPRK
ncbi:hypothetical protein GOODEAATRI_024789 [Goodea atripinnis]|uniref:Uncharacterized protein n=1 Tax=Goodea atripinnis TaxID=208336 RepID=A0ABV0Q1G1_9TELE